MKVRLRPGALKDLEEIRRWIARDDPVRALAFVKELRARAASLADRPNRTRMIYETPLGPVRKLGHGDYLLFYRVGDDGVEVIGVRHARRSTSSWPR